MSMIDNIVGRLHVGQSNRDVVRAIYRAMKLKSRNAAPKCAINARPRTARA